MYKHYYTKLDDTVFLFRSTYLYRKIFHPGGGGWALPSNSAFDQKNLTTKDFLLKDCFLAHCQSTQIWIAIERQSFFQLIENIVDYGLVSSYFPLNKIVLSRKIPKLYYISPQEKVKQPCSLCCNQLLRLVEDQQDTAFSTIEIAKKCLLGMKKDLFPTEAGTIELYNREFIECLSAFGHKRTPKRWNLEKLVLLKFI